MADLRRFAGPVFDALCESKRPLAQADHKDLNALGRDAAAAAADSLPAVEGARRVARTRASAPRGLLRAPGAVSRSRGVVACRVPTRHASRLAG